MGEIFKKAEAKHPMAFEGERFTGEAFGQIVVEHLHRYCLAREYCADKDVLDVASGEGYGSAILAQVARSVVGVDYAPEAVAHASREFGSENLTYRAGDIRDLDFPDASFDVIISFETLEHIREQNKALSELKRVLRPGGLLIISTPDREKYSPRESTPNHYHLLELSLGEFTSLIETKFTHHVTLQQVPMVGSIIYSNYNGTNTSVSTYEERGNDYIEATRGVSWPLYHVAICSDAPISEVRHSIYVTSYDLERYMLAFRDLPIYQKWAEDRMATLVSELTWAKERADALPALQLHAEHLEKVIQELKDSLTESNLKSEENDRLQTAVVDLNSRLRDSAAELDMIRGELLLLAEERVSLGIELDAAKVEGAAFAAQAARLAQLDKDYLAVSKERRDLAEVVTEQRNELERLAANLERVESLGSTLLADLSESEQNVLRVTKALARTEEQNLHVTEKLTLANDENLIISNDLAQCHARIERLNTDLSSANCKMLGYHHCYDALLNELNTRHVPNLNTDDVVVRSISFDRSIIIAALAAFKDRSLRSIARGGLIYFRRLILHLLYATVRRGRQNFDKQKFLIENSGIFDEGYYLANNSDVASYPEGSITHFIKYGVFELRNPNALFDLGWYYAQNSDVLADGANALTHYIEYGWKEGRSPGQGFDVPWYLSRYPDVVAAGEEPLAHFVKWGRAEGRLPLPTPVNNDDIPDRTVSRAMQLANLGLNVIRDNIGIKVAFGLVTYNNSVSEIDRCLRSIVEAYEHSNALLDSEIHSIDNGETSYDASYLKYDVRMHEPQGNVGFGRGHNALMCEAFENGADFYIAVNPDGFFHYDAVESLLRMASADRTPALIEAIQIPEEHPKWYDPETFETPWASGALLMIPRRIYEKIGGFDDDFFMYCEDVDLSWRARAAGFKVKVCPSALFYHPVMDREFDLQIHKRFLRAGIILARKWSGHAFERSLLEAAVAYGADLEGLQAIESHVPTGVADFSHNFSFGPTRW
jgi:GT2 family glycosyltransferase/ubiquinone/menaquinone biosynthesis C-methylase UbiE